METSGTNTGPIIHYWLRKANAEFSVNVFGGPYLSAPVPGAPYTLATGLEPCTE